MLLYSEVFQFGTYLDVWVGSHEGKEYLISSSATHNWTSCCRQKERLFVVFGRYCGAFSTTNVAPTIRQAFANRGCCAGCLWMTSIISTQRFQSSKIVNTFGNLESMFFRILERHEWMNPSFLCCLWSWDFVKIYFQLRDQRQTEPRINQNVATPIKMRYLCLDTCFYFQLVKWVQYIYGRTASRYVAHARRNHRKSLSRHPARSWGVPRAVQCGSEYRSPLAYFH